MTRNTMANEMNRYNALNTFEELLALGVIPIVNENDTISTYELDRLEQFGDNDTLSAVVAALIHADLLVLLSDIDGLYTDDPNRNAQAEFISLVEHVDDRLLAMGKGPGSGVGTGACAWSCRPSAPPASASASCPSSPWSPSIRDGRGSP